ncbi:MAG: SpoIIIAC/SpoIIIAD family protein [Acutalibacteraceae bacterium]|nr:SpoIIIAC/SpoIIIAD family protein [Acutalibacteraceae bacterium]
MIFTMVYGIIKQLLSAVLSIISETNVIYDDYIFLLLKISGIAFITQIGTDVCKDAGSAVLATGVEFAGKVVIITLCIPLLRGVVEMAAALVR